MNQCYGATHQIGDLLIGAEIKLLCSIIYREVSSSVADSQYSCILSHLWSLEVQG